MTSNPASKKAIALLLLVFGLGVAFGALGLRLMSARVYGARTAPRAEVFTLILRGSPRRESAYSRFGPHA